ncbi:MAG: hypothetical protein JWN98_1149, partial [Abditibacteriota bacterium]|nr:hypothetical protein [Abditibacteriota bacterium]
SALEKLAVRLRGPLLFEGGSDWYTVFPNRPLQMGARLSPGRGGSSAPGDLRVQMQIRQSTSRRVVWQQAWPASQQSTLATWTPPRGQRGRWQVEVTLRRGAEVLDALAHDVHVWDYAARPQFITAAQGQFRWKGKPWKPHGVNYMPSSGIARDLPEEGEEFELWIGKAPYDPAIVARDLDNVRGLGLNAISIFIYGGSRFSGNLLDILRQCQERGFKVNLSLRPGTPLDFAAQWAEIRPIIELFQLQRCDTIFAYDLAWEPNWGNHVGRRVHDAAWTAWVKQRYGTLEVAERAWEFPMSRAGDGLTNPSDEQVSHDGAWRKMVVDYRRFLADLLHEKYGQARKTVRGLDPNHLVSFRMSEAGNPTYRGDAFLPYDFPGLAEAVDFLAPEAYGRIGGWDKVRPGWFEVAYARAIAPQLPVVWSEVGVSTAVPGLDEPSPDRLQLQTELFRAFYRMMKASGSNGIFYWWNAGGFRAGENSDYGILNPDGTDREASRVIRENAASFLRAAAPVRPDAMLGIRLWTRAEGPFGIYEEAGPQFWRLVEQGKQPGLFIQNK